VPGVNVARSSCVVRREFEGSSELSTAHRVRSGQAVCHAPHAPSGPDADDTRRLLSGHLCKRGSRSERGARSTPARDDG
jgi:hypothetical protein